MSNKIKRILIIGHDGKVSNIKDGPWGKFYQEFLIHNYILANSNFEIPFDALVAHSHSNEAIQNAIKHRVPKNRRFLVLWEPEVVDNRIYKQEVLDLYGHIFSPSVEWNYFNSEKFHYFHWPQERITQVENYENWSKRKNKFVVIQGNKFSARTGELYSLRRQVIYRYKKQIDLYGTHWNEGIVLDLMRWLNSLRKSSLTDINISSLSTIGKKYENYNGNLISKFETLKKYKFSIVIENMSNYVSEKLFDSIAAGCLTIYIGPNLERHGLSDEHVITAKPNINDIENKMTHLLNLSANNQYKLVLNQNSSYLQFNKSHNNEAILKQLAYDIISFLKR